MPVSRRTGAVGWANRAARRSSGHSHALQPVSSHALWEVHRRITTRMGAPQVGQWILKKHEAAWRFFQMQPASYRKALSWWIISAKKEETRLKRLEKLIAHSVQGQRLPEYTPRKPKR